MNRRNFLRGAGAAALAMTGAGIWRAEKSHAFDPGSGPAYAPWADWQQESVDPLERLVRAAILAANPHNTQPWKFCLQEGAIDVYADTSRRIGEIDPFLREMHLSIGCALENLLLAATTAGYKWRLDQSAMTGDATLQPIVRVLLKEGPSREADLYAAIPKRHTNRGSYSNDSGVDEALLRGLAGAGNSDMQVKVFWFRGREEMQAFGKLVVAGTEAIIADPGQSRSSAQWMRTSWSDIQHFRDGLTYDAQALTPSKQVMAKLLPPLSVRLADRYWLTATRDVQVATAGAFGLIALRDSQDVAHLVEAGRLWQRMQLFATLHGAAMQPLNQPVERRDRERQLGLPPSYGRLLADLQQDASWEAVMPFRVGYAKHSAGPSPRRCLPSVLL